MALSKTQIQIDFNTACREADKLEEAANGLKRLANQELAGTIRDLSSGWKGDTASRYFSKADTVKTEIAATAESLYKIAATIRTNARNIYNAEMEAIRIAETDSSN